MNGDELYPDRDRYAGAVRGGGHYTETIILSTEQMSALADLLGQLRWNRRGTLNRQVTVILPDNYNEALIRLQADLFNGGR